MDNIDECVKSKSFEIEKIFANINKNGFIEKFVYPIDVQDLHIKYADTINITQSGDFSEMFKELQAYDDYPALYYFSINPKIGYDEIITLIEKVELELSKPIPVRNKYKKNCGILYVGKVKRIAWGRLIQHLGYHKKQNSHGLHLEFWARKTSLDLNLTFTIMFFEKETNEYIQILEKALAEKIKPIIGKH